MKFFVMTVMLVLILLSPTFAEDTYFWDGDRKIQLTLLESPGGENADTARYRTSDGAIVSVTNKMILKLTDNGAIQSCLDEFQLTLVRTLGEHTFLLESANHEETLRVSQALAHLDGVEYAHPDFISHSEPR